MVDGSHFVPGKTGAIRGVHQADVTLGTPIEQGLFADLVVNAHQPSVFMDSRGRGGCDQVEVVVSRVVRIGYSRPLPLEGGVRIGEERGTTAECSRGLAPGVSLQDGAHLLRRRIQYILLVRFG